jgi:hypothetical protein
MKGDDIATRLVAVAVGVVKIVSALPDSLVGRHVAGQLHVDGKRAAQKIGPRVVLRLCQMAASSGLPARRGARR